MAELLLLKFSDFVDIYKYGVLTFTHGVRTLSYLLRQIVLSREKEIGPLGACKATPAERNFSLASIATHTVEVLRYYVLYISQTLDDCWDRILSCNVL